MIMMVMVKPFRRIIGGLVVACLSLVVVSGTALAAQSSSNNYQVNEVFFGNGGELNACSDNFCSRQSAGETAVGNTSSNNYQAQGGFNTSDEPLLEVYVNGGTYDLGILDTADVKSVAPTFIIRNYLSNGYVVHITGNAPTNNSGGHSLQAMTVASPSQPGAEQFGLNVVANSDPSAGADPQQIPDSSFGFGIAETGYDTPNYFKFVDGDIIASSPKSSGTTLYTMTAIANISPATPGGAYGGSLSVVVVPTF
jgi:hypothetical protein